MKRKGPTGVGLDTHRHVTVSQHRQEVLVPVVFDQVRLTRLQGQEDRRTGIKEEEEEGSSQCFSL